MSKAIIVRTTGGPEVLKLEDREVGEPGPGQIRIRQHAIGLNFVDTYQRSGLYPRDLPFVAGNEAAGEVTAVGAEVADFRVGDRVAYQGDPGAYAEERLIFANRVAPLPDGIDYETAAAIGLKGATAYYLLFLTHKVEPGQTILFQAAAGGLGLIACQWAHALGARVIGTAGSDEKVALARANGCDEVINYRTEDFVDRVRQLTNGQGVDVVYDGVGKDTFVGGLDCLKPRGLMVSLGNASGPVSIPNLGILSTKGSLYVTRPTGGTYWRKTEDYRAGLAAVYQAVLDGTIKVSINHRFALADAAEAHRALEGRRTTGSVILLP
ncbi:quinone oxidoreductase family protein [Paradevosia shaoguanensis]|uniref:quinone oxidoreductase family protein n=1 Tax=Paradevosia shaoguanensis TaxID=1335043 RepID=UPI003C73FA7F